MIRWLLSFMVLFFVLPASADSAAVAAASEACKAQILSINAADVTTENLERTLDACDDFPLSDSLSGQTLAAIVGEDILLPLDVFTYLTGVKHGFSEGDAVFNAVPTLHAVLGAFNNVVFYSAVVLVFIASLFKAIRLMVGDHRASFGQIAGILLPSKIARLIFVFPTFGWVTPFQFIGLGLLLLGFVLVKQLVVYIFLMGFSADVAIGVSETTKEGLTHEIGDNILMYHCDIKRREGIMEIVQTHYNTRATAVLSTDPVYQCINSAAPSNMAFGAPEASDVFTRVRGVPPVIEHTQSCIDNNKLHWEDVLGGGEIADCGALTLNVPTNKASFQAMDKLQSLTTSAEIRDQMRNIAIQLYTYQCRKTAMAEDYTGNILSKCLALEAVHGGYRYVTAPDPVTGQIKLSAYTEPMTSESRRRAIERVRNSVESVRSVLVDNTAALLDLLQAMAAPKNESDANRTSLQQSLASDAAPQLISEQDAEDMVMRIRRGAWGGSALFFDKISENLAESTLVGALSKVYAADLPDDDNLYERTSRDLTDSLDLLGLAKGVNVSKVDAVARNFLPMVSLYDYQRTCWIEPSSCQTVPINPFYYTIKDGIKMLERSLIGLGISSAAEYVAKKVTGKKNRDIQLFSVIGNYFWAYTVYGLLLAVVVPAFPFFKLLAMFFAWSVDVLITLVTANAKIALSTISGEDRGGVFNRDVKDAFRRLVGLALYFTFILIGVMIFFFMFTALFAFNVLVLGVLDSLINTYGPFSVIDMGVMRVIVDGIMVALIVYEIRICMPFMESVPKDMAKHFALEITPHDEVIHTMWSQSIGWMPTFANQIKSVSDGAHKALSK